MTTNTSGAAQPVQGRPLLPKDYGVPESDEGTLPWPWAVERIEQARNYWFCTTRPDGRPHAMPAWGAWVDDAFYFDGSPETRRGKNLAQNPSIVVHLESGDEVVVLEGEAHLVGKPERAFAEKLAAALGAKYGPTYVPTPDTWDQGGLYVVTLKVAFGWDSFPTALTRWRF
ncbi:MAG: pyridoxamine 5'-phosphate oxidase family protein [Chloroflexi bacterium]|nr:pyridoxamine 5'-phosphate oxidase family protein [Chloroflexota bacterium]